MKATQVKTNKREPLTLSNQKVTEIFIDSFATKSDVHNLETKLSKDIHNLDKKTDEVRRDGFWLKWIMGIGFTSLLMLMLGGFTWLAGENANTRQELKAEMRELKTDVNERMDKLDERIDKIDERMNKLDERIDKIDERMNKLDERMDKIEAGQKETQRLLLRLIKKK